MGDIGPVQVSVNVAGRQFSEGDLEADVARALVDTDIPPGLLELELTETSLMINTERTIACLRNLRQRGVKVSIDDFGTGYSSLAYLQRFPIDKLKIDIAFIRNVSSNPEDAAIVRAIITMAHSLHLLVIAEGVETVEQQRFLLRHRCDQIQGYLISRPLSAAMISQLMAQRRPLNQAASEAVRETLLIVDDDPFTLEILATQLGSEQFSVLQAKSGAQAFDVLAHNEVQVILCDQRMPEMAGTEFFEKVKAIYPDTFRMVLSGEADLETMLTAFNKGAIDRFYTKPWNQESLLSNVKEAFLNVQHRSATQ